MEPGVKNLTNTERATSEEMTQAPSITAFIIYRQRSTLGALPEVVLQLAATILQDYIYEGIPVHMGPAWTQRSLERANAKGSHFSACTPKITEFIRGDMRQHVQCCFRILLPAVNAVRVFGDKLKLSCIDAAHQDHLRPCLITKPLKNPDEGMPSVNETTEREVASEPMQFRRTLPHILQATWESDRAKGPIWV